MSQNPVTQTIRIVPLFLFWLLLLSHEGHSEEFAVPNSGSPYKNLADLDAGQILHLPTGLLVSREQMMDSISASRVIYIGETHDNIEAHKVQLQIIQLLAEKYPLAIGLEMFRHSAPGDTLYPEIDATNVSARKRKYLFRQSSDETGRGATAVKKRKRPSDA